MSSIIGQKISENRCALITGTLFVAGIAAVVVGILASQHSRPFDKVSLSLADKLAIGGGIVMVGSSIAYFIPKPKLTNEKLACIAFYVGTIGALAIGVMSKVGVRPFSDLNSVKANLLVVCSLAILGGTALWALSLKRAEKIAEEQVNKKSVKS